jgi:hypothetical protein
MWRSTNGGTTWSQVNSDGFGAADNKAAYSTRAFAGALYVGTWAVAPASFSQTRIWSSTDGTSFGQANTDGFGDSSNAEPWAMAEFNGYLYVGVANYPDGAEVWRSNNGSSWTQASPNGFGDLDNVEVSAMAVLGHCHDPRSRRRAAARRAAVPRGIDRHQRCGRQLRRHGCSRATAWTFNTAAQVCAAPTALVNKVVTGGSVTLRGPTAWCTGSALPRHLQLDHRQL